MRARLFLAGLAAAALLPVAAGAMEPEPMVFAAWTDRLEYRAQNGPDTILWDANAWYGKDYDKAWIKTEGQIADGTVEDGEAQLLWSHAVSPFWDLQAGIRQDFGMGPDRTHGVLGIEGLAPGWWEIDAAMFLSDKGDVTARVEAEYDMLITQKLVLQPRAELNVAFQDVPALGIGSGPSDFALDLRLRYKIRPEFAPYIGVSWTRSVGNTADFAQAAGEKTSSIAFITGIRLEY
jgi:copper resistance protein B